MQHQENETKQGSGRQLKFRAWDTEKNHFRKDDSFLVSPQTGLAHPWYDNNEAGSANHKWILTQSTGLFDRNGVEIYSGDIIHDDRGEIGVIVDFDYGQQYMWLNEYFDWIKGEQVVIADAVGDMQTASWLGGNEIIGNIYENPELLNNNN